MYRYSGFIISYSTPLSESSSYRNRLWEAGVQGLSLSRAEPGSKLCEGPLKAGGCIQTFWVYHLAGGCRKMRKLRATLKYNENP